jgi:16S rRNA (adenine1518-N6/adenine1519-N6)-dimethyltransferase
VRLRARTHAAVAAADESLLWALVSAGFMQRRKTILNNLRHAPAPLAARVNERGGAAALLAAADLDPQRRAETLTIAEWARLVEGLEGK